MTALADSLRRIWSAKSLVPHLTGWGTDGCLAGDTLLGSACGGIAAVVRVVRQSAPTVLPIILNFFR